MTILDRFRLDGEIALVTGGSKGIGRACAHALADAGADIIVASRTQADLEIVVGELEAKGRRAIAVPTDMGDIDAIRALYGAAKEKLGAPTIVINNVGGGGPNDPRAQDIDNFEAQFHFNVANAYLLTALAAPGMEEAGRGAVINISSQAGVIAQKGFAAYGTAKAAMIQMTRNLAHDYAPTIRINAIAPGAVKTDALMKYLNDETEKLMADKTPLARLAEAEDVAAAALYLASPASSYMTGRTLVLDGGAEWTTWPF
ncbi:MAG: glucose 1-dehydrogenase [Pseudomonadota bacterium]